MNAVQAQNTDSAIVVIDGITYHVDPETGEIGAPVVQPSFLIDSDERAEWFFDKLTNAKADKERALFKLAALRANQEAEVVKAERREERLLEFFGPQLAEYAKTRLKGGEKTARFAWGAVAFTDRKASVVASPDKEAALAWAKVEAPEAVKVTEAFLSTAVEKGKAEGIKAAVLDGATHPAFVLKPAETTWKVTTGVK